MSIGTSHAETPEPKPATALEVPEFPAAKQVFEIVMAARAYWKGIESNHTIGIDSFVPKDELDKRYLDHPYYIAPGGSQ